MKTRESFLLAGIAAVVFSLMLALPSPAVADDYDNDSIIPDLIITPSMLNMKSRGRFVTAHINLPPGYDLPDAHDVKLYLVDADNSTEEITALRTNWDIFDLVTAKFSRSEVQDLISGYYEELPAIVPLAVTIEADNETLLYTDDIRVKIPGLRGKGYGKGNGNGNGNGGGKGGGKGGKK